MPDNPTILINGLSIGGGGGLTVGVELTRALAQARPRWTIRLLLTQNHPLHEEARDLVWPLNASLIWADANTRNRRARDAYETLKLPKRCNDIHATALLQLNGMLPPIHLDLPVICHHQDPWPYRPQAWFSLKHRLIAFLKRRRHRKALYKADRLTFTSQYLLDTLTRHHRLPADQIATRCSVLSNGLPDSFYQLADNQTNTERADEILTVSNVSPYKQQWRVIDALAELTRRGNQTTSYRIIGAGSPADLQALNDRAASHGLTDRVLVEGRAAAERVTWAYQRAKAFALHSQCESFGIPAIEAMAHAVPVVVADCCALPEVTADAALHADPDSTTALADALEEILTVPETAKRLIANGKQRIHAYRWSDSGEKLAQLIETL